MSKLLYSALPYHHDPTKAQGLTQAVCYPPGVRGLPNQRNWLQARQNSGKGFPGVPVQQREQNKPASLCLLTPPRRTPVPYMRWSWGCVQWSGRGGLGGLPAPQAVLCAGGMCSTLLCLLPIPCFAPGYSKSGRWVLVSLYLLGLKFSLTELACSCF